MTMHLEGPWLNTLSSRRRKVKMTSLRREKLERDLVDHNKFLMKIRQPRMTFSQYVDYVEGRHKRPTVAVPVKKVEPYRRDSHAHIPSVSNTGPAVCARKDPLMYTGDKLLGIGIMHKSNLVPIFSTEEASEVSRMRRG